MSPFLTAIISARMATAISGGVWLPMGRPAEATLTAAVAGLGIAMGHAVLVDHDVREGRLVEVWPHHAPLAAGYHLLQSKRMLRNPAARAVAEWLLREATALHLPCRSRRAIE